MAAYMPPQFLCVLRQGPMQFSEQTLAGTIHGAARMHSHCGRPEPMGPQSRRWDGIWSTSIDGMAWMRS
eukprot:scaffold44836_cov20-Tisochrysis_lutea.AAC.1